MGGWAPGDRCGQGLYPAPIAPPISIARPPMSTTRPLMSTTRPPISYRGGGTRLCGICPTPGQHLILPPETRPPISGGQHCASVHESHPSPRHATAGGAAMSMPAMAKTMSSHQKTIHLYQAQHTWTKHTTLTPKTVHGRYRTAAMPPPPTKPAPLSLERVRQTKMQEEDSLSATTRCPPPPPPSQTRLTGGPWQPPRRAPGAGIGWRR